MKPADPLADPVFAVLDRMADRQPEELSRERKACLLLWDAILTLRARVTQPTRTWRRSTSSTGRWKSLGSKARFW